MKNISNIITVSKSRASEETLQLLPNSILVSCLKLWTQERREMLSPFLKRHWSTYSEQAFRALTLRTCLLLFRTLNGDFKKGSSSWCGTPLHFKWEAEWSQWFSHEYLGKSWRQRLKQAFSTYVQSTHLWVRKQYMIQIIRSWFHWYLSLCQEGIVGTA